MKAILNNRALATTISSLEGYAGGYLYPGARVEVGWEGSEGLLFPRPRHAIHRVKEYDRTPPGDFLPWNKKALASYPVGAEVSIVTTISNFRAWEVWRKEGPCRWRCVECVEWPDHEEDWSEPVHLI